MSRQIQVRQVPLRQELTSSKPGILDISALSRRLKQAGALNAKATGSRRIVKISSMLLKVLEGCRVYCLLSASFHRLNVTGQREQKQAGSKMRDNLAPLLTFPSLVRQVIS